MCEKSKNNNKITLQNKKRRYCTEANLNGERDGQMKRKVFNSKYNDFDWWGHVSIVDHM